MVSPNRRVAAIGNAAILTGGWTLIAMGVLALPLPGPFTTPALTSGSLVLARRSPTFRQTVAALRRPFPQTSAALTRRSRRWPRAVRYVVLRTDPGRVRRSR
jgi:uncharacterized membrane protein YbaN (DUF454 family)